jgi:hypothetical protein
MPPRLKSLLFPFVPAHVNDPFGLARRMISSGNRVARFTLFTTALGVLCIPLDMLLSLRERRLVASAPAAPARPTVFVCGPARSGTTLVFQVLCRYLDVACLQNVTALFPRSPIVVSRIYRRLARGRADAARPYENYYGKTAGLGGPSEANHIWHRWVQPDATGFRTILPPAGARAAACFFAAFGEAEQKPVVAKNNNLNAFADVIACAFPDALILCLRRSPEYLAQSLLQARREIHGSVSRGYGVQDTGNGSTNDDPVPSVCAQVAFLDRMAEDMRARIGAERFWFVDYEEFCRSPGTLVSAVAAKLAIPVAAGTGPASIAPIPANNVVRDEAELASIRHGLKAAGVAA